MQICKLGSWNEFEEKISAINSGAVPLYRGHSNAKWELKTSLERYSYTSYSIRRYNACLLRIQPALASFTGRNRELIEDISVTSTPNAAPPNYEFMCHARQHGFPSPLLDWSESPWIALFFAYRHASMDDEVAIYINNGVTGDSVGESNGMPVTGNPGPYLSAHTGHFMQQCRYTLVTKKINSDWFYCSHEEFFSRQADMNQDLLTKVTMPGYLKYDILKKLHKMNINAYTLYGTEEGLMEKLAFTEILEYNELMMNT